MGEERIRMRMVIWNAISVFIRLLPLQFSACSATLRHEGSFVRTEESLPRWVSEGEGTIKSRGARIRKEKVPGAFSK